jgi:hypothetical protein
MVEKLSRHDRFKVAMSLLVLSRIVPAEKDLRRSLVAFLLPALPSTLFDDPPPRSTEQNEKK